MRKTQHLCHIIKINNPSFFSFCPASVSLSVFLSESLCILVQLVRGALTTAQLTCSFMSFTDLQQLPPLSFLANAAIFLFSLCLAGSMRAHHSV